jgi:uncharacterized protein YoaH (UPF0181 family)
MAELDLEQVNPYTGESPAGQMRATVGLPSEMPTVSDDASYDALAPGSSFRDPEGNVRKKPWQVRSGRHADADYEAVPEGATFLDPEGNERQKPSYQPLSYSAQTLHSMAINPAEQKKALEYAYPDAEIVQDASGEWVVNDNGVQRKAGATRGVGPMLGAVTAGVAPTTGAVLGALGGAAGGSTVPGFGTVAGGAAGGAGGSIAGQMVNDAIFHAIAGTQRSAGEEAANLGLAGLTGAAGAGVGRGVAVVVPSIKAGASAATAAVPGALRSVTGATKEGLERGQNLMERGYAVPPSATMPEAPHIQNMVEVLDPAFRTNKPLVKQNLSAYEKEAGTILKEAGVPEFEDLVKAPSLTNPEAAMPTARVGEALKERAIQQAGEADARLQQAFEARREALAAGAPDSISQQKMILQAQEESRRAVDNLLNENYARINQDVERAYNLSRTGANTGEAWQQVADQLRATRQAIGERANRMYEASHELGGNTPIASDSLTQAARDFASSLPEEFRTTQPALVRRLEAMAGEVGDDGEVIRPPTNPTFAELHQIRTEIRSNADFSRLNSDIRNGTYKHFNNVVDEVIHDAGAAPNLRAAAQALDQADAFYRENIPIFNAKELQAVMRGVEAGEPANPIALYNTLVKADQPQMTARVRELVGPNLWSAVQAAHVQDLMRKSMSKTVPGQVDGRAFARNVLEDYNNGLLQQVQNPQMVEQLMRQVNLLGMADGKIPIPAVNGDRMLDIVAKARAAEEQAKNLARTDPLVALKKEGSRIDQEERRALAQAGRGRKAEPLGFLFDATVGTQEAANRILGNPDLLVAAADKFGRTSSEFKLLQQAYLWKVLKGDMNPGKELAKIAPEIQHLMFPGTTLGQLQALAKDMDFLANTKLMKGADSMGSSMMAVSKVEHPPLGSVRGVVKRIPLAGTASEFVARATLTKFYAIVAKLTSQSPGTMSFMLKGLQGTPEQRLATKAAIDAVLQRGTAVGAGMGEGAYQGRDVR